jgi:glycosyltransferase involved in cell wall biosynthesis
MNRSGPRVSVLMAVRNGERYLAEGVASIVTQTLPDWELIVVDDASRDATPALLARLAHEHRRLRTVTLPARRGPPAALDHALARARGEYVATLDHDDLAHPDRLARQAARLDAEPACGAVGCELERIDEHGRSLGPRRWMARRPATTPVTIGWILPFHTPVIRSGLMARRAVLEGIGGFATTRPFADDYELCARLADAAPFVNLPEALVRYRRHAGQISRTSTRGQRAAVLLLRQHLIWQRLGTVEPLDVLSTLGLAGGTPPADDGEAERAAALCRRLFAACIARDEPTGADLAWIEADYGARLNRLAVRAA